MEDEAHCKKGGRGEGGGAETPNKHWLMILIRCHIHSTVLVLV